MFTSFTQNILSAILLVERLCGKKLQLPIISYLLITIEKNKARFSATNLEQGVTIEILGKSEGTSKIAIPARMTSELLRSIKSEKVVFSPEGTTLKIEADGRRAVIQGLNGDEFPLIPKHSGPITFSISPVIFGQALNRVTIAASRNDIRPELSGVYFSWNPKTDDSKLSIAATDSFRLAERNFESKNLTVNDKGEGGSCILPLRAAEEIARIAGEIEGDLAIAITETQFGMKWANGEFVSRLVEGSFPSYRAIIPQTFQTEVRCQRKAILELLRQAGLFASKISDVKFRVEKERKGIVVSSSDVLKGEYEGGLECTVSGEDVSLSFNYQFLIDGLERIEADEVMIGLNDPSAPILISPASGDISYRYIVMPLRV